MVPVVSYRLPLACRDWKLAPNFVWLECLAKRCIRKFNSAANWSFYAWNSGNSKRWNIVGLEIPLVIRVLLSSILKSVAFFSLGLRPVGKSLHPWVCDLIDPFQGVFWKNKIHGKKISPHSGQGKPGMNAPGIYPQLRQIELVRSSIISPNILD